MFNRILIYITLAILVRFSAIMQQSFSYVLAEVSDGYSSFVP